MKISQIDPAHRLMQKYPPAQLGPKSTLLFEHKTYAEIFGIYSRDIVELVFIVSNSQIYLGDLKISEGNADIRFRWAYIDLYKIF